MHDVPRSYMSSATLGNPISLSTTQAFMGVSSVRIDIFILMALPPFWTTLAAVVSMAWRRRPLCTTPRTQ
eukprot:8253601-Pyramimonas_sp.AAC.1